MGFIFSVFNEPHCEETVSHSVSDEIEQSSYQKFLKMGTCVIRIFIPHSSKEVFSEGKKMICQKQKLVFLLS